MLKKRIAHLAEHTQDTSVLCNYCSCEMPLDTFFPNDRVVSLSSRTKPLGSVEGAQLLLHLAWKGTLI